MNFHNEITKLHQRVAAIEAKAGIEPAKELEPAVEGYVETGAAKPAAESKPGTKVQKGPPPVKAETPLAIYELANGYALARGDERIATFKTRKEAEKAKAAEEAAA